KRGKNDTTDQLKMKRVKYYDIRSNNN
ncbi:hypothetical protein LCGC14_1421610, partial [marine sediment metagenome]